MESSDMTPALRIGLLTPGWPGQNTANGIATAVYFLAMGLHEIGQTPVILAQKLDGAAPPDIPVIPLPEVDRRLWDRLRDRVGDPYMAGQRHMVRRISAAAKQAIAQHGIDAVLMEETNGWPASVQDHISAPVFITLHGPWTLLKTHASLGSSDADQQREARELKGFRAAAGLIGPSRNVMAAVEKVDPLPKTPKTVLPNSFQATVPDQLAATLPQPDILFIGRFDALKGADTVLAAFERLLETHPDSRLTFAGPDKGLKQADGSLVHMEECLARMPAHVSANITYKGLIGREEVARLRSTHAIALIASRYENLNYTLLEGMAAGQAIVSTAVGGPAEVLKDRHTALLVPPGDPEAMALALRRVIEDTSLRQSLGQAARHMLEKDFAPDAIAEQTVSFIRSAIAPGSS